MSQPPVLIESWLPIEAIGAEAKREHSTGLHPAPNRLHVWWARRPLIASRAAVLGGVLPQWSADWPEYLMRKFPNKESYHQWFIRVNGILGDPVAARKLIDWETRTGLRSTQDKYGYSRAFTQNPKPEDLETIFELILNTWGDDDVCVLDPFSGGGSIPFESLRWGFKTYANDLNPVAALILKGTLDYPARFGLSLVDDLQKWGKRWHALMRTRLESFYKAPPGEPDRTIYMWARTVACPSTGKPVPLAPNWWINSGENKIAIRLIAESTQETPIFQIISGNRINWNPDIGTINRGVARSPWTGETILGDYIKSEAQAGRMGEILYCVEVNTGKGKEYHCPSEFDRSLVAISEKYLKDMRNEWISTDILPVESLPNGNKTSEPIRYGIFSWDDMFSARQLITLIVFSETMKELEVEIESEEPPEKAKAILTYFSFAFDKCINYNSRLSSWHASRSVIRSVFDRHDFAFAWTFVEFNGAGNLMLWAVNQIVDSYREIANLINPAQQSYSPYRQKFSLDERLTINQGSASNQPWIRDDSIHNITVDPPYYDNVQYAELSDFFYVWLKRSVGHLFPEFFKDELTNKDDEAVANPVRFAGMGKNKKELAEQDYERKMAGAFKEMHRVLRPDGVLTVMFTHKRVEAWDTLASALIGAGFTIKASWPIHTESEHSLHQAKKNAASSTILLVCRKREVSGEGAIWWDDIQESVRQVARQKAQEFSEQGIHGVDLYLSTFGPTLSIISEHWPVLTSDVDPKTGQPKPLRPEIALDLAREEVVHLRKQGLLQGREVAFDPVTDWYLMAWDAFKAEQFPYDEARKLAIALGIDLDHHLMAQKRLAAKKGSFVILQTPVQRRKKGMVDDEINSFVDWVDAAHTAMMVYEEDGAGACDVFLQRSGLKRDSIFKACLQAMINAIPAGRIKGKFVRPEAEMLENIRLAFFDDLQPPKEEEPEMPEGVQLGLWAGDTRGGDQEDVDEEMEE